MARRIAVVTTSRADYGHLRWILEGLQAHPGIDLRLIATGAHLAERFGRSVDEIEADGITVHERLECLLDSDTDLGMAKTIGLATLGLADCLARLRPELLLLIADRYEMLAPAAVALALRIPIAHIEGGEVSEGAIDEAVRNALTKLAHLHFTPTELSRRRVLGMGEEPWRVHRVGAPSLDYLRRAELLERDALEAALQWPLEERVVLVACHPVTLAESPTGETDALYQALGALPHQTLFCFPNADMGSRELIDRARAFCARRPAARLFVNLNPVLYWSLLRQVSVLVGNSSSGIMETASLGLPTVDIGDRQRGRQRPANVLHARPEADEILDRIAQALDPGFRASLCDLENPYGDGRAAERIVRILASAPLGEVLLRKAPTPPMPEPGDD